MNDDVQWIRFDGRVPFQDGSASRFSVAGSFREADPTGLDLEIFWHGNDVERRRGAAAFMANKQNHVWLRNENAEDGHIELLGISGESTTYAKTSPISTRPQFAALQRGLHSQPETRDARFHVEVRLAPSGFFENGIVEQHYTGEIKITPLPAHTPIQITSRYGELLVRDAYSYESGEEHGNKVTKQIQKSTISGEIAVPKGSSLHEVNEELKKEIELVRRALSLCFRQPVQYFQITYRNLSEPGRPSPFFRRRLPQVAKRQRIDEFIQARNLGNGGLQRLIAAIRSSPQSPDLVRAIDFLAESYTSTLENAFFLAFSAMETVVNIAAGPAAEGTYNKSQWKALRHALESAISKTAAELSLDPTDLHEKLPELKRPALRKRVRIACANYAPATMDLWPHLDFLQGLGEATKIRNGLFHAAAYSDGTAIVESLIRVRAFAERLIAKILKWPDDELWVWRDQNLKFMNINSKPRSESAGPEA